MYGKESTYCIADQHESHCFASSGYKNHFGQSGPATDGPGLPAASDSSSEAWLALNYLQSYARPGAADAVQTRTLPSQRRPPGSAVRRSECPGRWAALRLPRGRSVLRQCTSHSGGGLLRCQCRCCSPPEFEKVYSAGPGAHLQVELEVQT